MGLRFISPTAFKQGPGHLPLPLPGNVFSSSVRIWEAFAPPMMVLPPDWLDWCRQDVFVTRHMIETIQVIISKSSLPDLLVKCGLKRFVAANTNCVPGRH